VSFVFPYFFFFFQAEDGIRDGHVTGVQTCALPILILDGYPLCERGQGGTALALSATAAMAGGLIGMIFLAMAAPALAELALQFGPAEYFLTALLALSLVAAVVQGSVVKGLISGGLGLMLATVG